MKSKKKNLIPSVDYESFEAFNSEVDMLKGNIARICVSDDVQEIKEHTGYALTRLYQISDYRIRKLSENK